MPILYKYKILYSPLLVPTSWRINGQSVINEDRKCVYKFPEINTRIYFYLISI